jgi:uncharacterized protein YndB with AHSA1/START domain
MRTRGYAQRQEIQAPVDVVWVALTTDAHLARWLSPNARIRGGVGGSLCSTPAPGVTRDALIDAFEPGRRLRLLYLPDPGLPPLEGAIADDYLLEPDGEQTSVSLLGSGFPDSIDWDAYYRKVRSAQERAFARFKVFSERLHRGTS